MFKTNASDCNYGEIEMFVNMSPPQAIIRVLRVQGQTVVQQAGHPCRPALDMYKEVDLLKLFVAHVVCNGPLTAIPLENIWSKTVFVYVIGVFYAVKPPNSCEHH